MGYPLTGGSFLQVASEEAHLVLLPAANTVFTQENAALNAASGQATELPTVIAALVLAVVTAFVLYRAQRWLARRTNRVLSPGLVLASVLLAVSVIWLAAGFLAARSDLDRRHRRTAPAPAQNLALASIGVQQIRGDAVLNVISRSGNASFQDDFAATSKQVGPGTGTWLGDAAAAQESRRAGRRPRRGGRAGRDLLVPGQHPGVPARHGGQLRRRAEPGRRHRQPAARPPDTTRSKMTLAGRSPPTRPFSTSARHRGRQRARPAGRRS